MEGLLNTMESVRVNERVHPMSHEPPRQSLKNRHRTKPTSQPFPNLHFGTGRTASMMFGHVDTDLPDLLSRAWRELTRAVVEHRHGFHWPVVATRSGAELDYNPDARVVVLRAVDPDQCSFTFHTDRRSPKVAQIEAHPVVSAAFSDGRRRLQVRARCTARVPGPDAQETQDHWSRLREDSRSIYQAPHAPTTPSAALSHNRPESMDSSDADAGRDNFALVVCTVEHLDVLDFVSSGHSRGQWTYQDGKVTHGTWAQP